MEEDGPKRQDFKRVAAALLCWMLLLVVVVRVVSIPLNGFSFAVFELE